MEFEEHGKYTGGIMSRNGLSRTCFLLAGLGVCLTAALPAHGSVIIAADSVSAVAGSTGNSFDVWLTNTGPSAISVDTFSFNINILDTDITFTDVTTGTVAAPYIFPSSVFGPDLTGPNSGQTFAFFPNDVSGSGDVSIASGATVGLGHVLFDVAGGAAPGTFAVAFVQDPLVTNLSDANGNNIPIDTFTDGDVTILTPEPATVPLAGLAFLIAAAARRRLRIRR
jgi:hypothetical protein